MFCCTVIEGRNQCSNPVHSDRKDAEVHALETHKFFSKGHTNVDPGSKQSRKENCKKIFGQGTNLISSIKDLSSL